MGKTREQHKQHKERFPRKLMGTMFDESEKYNHSNEKNKKNRFKSDNDNDGWND